MSERLKLCPEISSEQAEEFKEVLAHAVGDINREVAVTTEYRFDETVVEIDSDHDSSGLPVHFRMFVSNLIYNDYGVAEEFQEFLRYYTYPENELIYSSGQTESGLIESPFTPEKFGRFMELLKRKDEAIRVIQRADDTSTDWDRY